jgi:hypothetical protein
MLMLGYQQTRVHLVAGVTEMQGNLHRIGREHGEGSTYTWTKYQGINRRVDRNLENGALRVSRRALVNEHDAYPDW